MKPPRATLGSSIAVGIILGASSAINGNPSHVSKLAFGGFFFFSVMIWVIGIDQLRNNMGFRGGMRVEKGDFHRFYFPVWRRMFGWFAGAIIGAVASNAILALFAWRF
jgi:hypothetical protein